MSYATFLQTLLSLLQLGFIVLLALLICGMLGIAGFSMQDILSVVYSGIQFFL